MKHLKRLVPALCFVAAISLSACGTNKDNGSSSNSPPPSDQPPSQPRIQIDPPPAQRKDLKFQDFGMIREFGGTDNAALFGLLPETGLLQFSKIEGPAFIKSYMAGTLTQASATKLFNKSAKPLPDTERKDLLAKFKGANVIYTEGYAGNLCNRNEAKYEIKASGTFEQTNVEITFQFEALPNPNGNCEFHIFSTSVRYL